MQASSHLRDETGLSTAYKPHGTCALPKGARLREYEVVDVLGEGGFSIVYLARDVQLNRTIAIKEFAPAAFSSREASFEVKVRSERHRDTFEAGLRGFINEGRLLAEFSHPALVKVLSFWEENGTAYMAMPYYSGKTLRAVLGTYGSRYGENWLRSVFAPILDALEMLHQQDVFHRDIAPDNILIQNDGSPVLLDLGSARRILGELQHALTVVIKPGYAPIEQYVDDPPTQQGPWTDIYAIGAVLYFAVTGTAPTASVSRMLKDTLPPLATTPRNGFSPSFLGAIDRALALQATDRPQSIGELRALLGITPDDYKPVALSPLHDTDSVSSVTSAGADSATIVLSPQKLADMAAQLKAHKTDTTAPLVMARADDASAGISVEVPGAEASSYDTPDPFAIKTNRDGDTTANAFPEMDDLLSGRLREHARLGAPSSVPSQTAATAHPSPARKADKKKRSLSLVPVLASIAAAALSAGWYWWMVAESDTPPSPTVTIASQVEPEPSPKTAPPDADQPAQQQAPDPVMPNSPPPAAIITVAATTSSIEPSAPDTAPPAPVQATTSPVPSSTPVSSPSTSSATPPTPASPSEPAINPGNQIAVNKPDKPRPPAAQASEKMGLLSISSWPWSEIWINGKKRGVNPPLREIRLEQGEYSVELRNPGFPPVDKSIVIIANQKTTVEHHFTPPVPVKED